MLLADINPFAYLECAAGMTERTGLRSGPVRGIHQILRATLVRPPCAHGVSKTEAREKYRRQD
jgi:hypothetical protein